MRLAAAGGSVPRVLIVDDDVSVSDTFSRTLRLEGYEVFAAFSAREGLVLARTHSPHAIILDLRMPLASAVSVVEAIRAIPGLFDAPIAIVTGDYFAPAPRTDQAVSLGATLQYKPVWRDELVRLARNMLPVPVRD